MIASNEVNPIASSRPADRNGVARRRIAGGLGAAVVLCLSAAVDAPRSAPDASLPVASIPPPQRSLDIPPIGDPESTAVLSGFAPIKGAAKEGEGTRREPGAGAGDAEGGAESPVRSVVWVLKPPGATVTARSDQPLLIQGGRFVPSTLAVTPGTRIDFRNEDREIRTVLGKGAGASFDRRLTRHGKVTPVTLARAGAVELSIKESPDAEGAIVVADTTFMAVATETGAFQIVGIPPGRRDVRIRLPDGTIVEKTVELKAGRELTVDWREAPKP